MTSTSLTQLYEQDELLWYDANARLLREKNFQAIDFEHIAEELESMGKQQRREFINHLTLLLMYLLKYQ